MPGCALADRCAGVIATVVALIAGASPARAEPLDPPPPPPPHLRPYHISGPPGLAGKLIEQGYDVTARRVDGSLERVDAILTGQQLIKVRAAGYLAQAVQYGSPPRFTTWKPYGGRSGVADQLRAIAARHRGIAKLQSIGTSVRGTRILALKITDNARTTTDGGRPAVLYSSLRDGREWIGGQVTMRLLSHVTEAYVRGDPAIRRLLAKTELWFVPVANPDGYDHTFTPANRFWGKNLRGIDLTHNFPTAFGHDDEGSSPDPSSQNYRGPRPASEPETRAFDALLRRVRFEFAVDYRAYGERLLRPIGWQAHTRTADEPIYQALVGADEGPAIPGYDVGLTADLGTSNGDPADHAHAAYSTLAFTVQLAEGCPGCGFAFPDDENRIEAEFRRNLPFALDVAHSARDPSRPVSHLTAGPLTPDFVVDEFPTSYGTTQPVQVTARRSLGPLRVHFRVGNGPERAVPTQPWRGGERYGRGYDTHYRRLRGTVTGTRPGDFVTVSFTTADGRAASKRFTYRVAEDIGGEVLILAAEDVTGTLPTQQRRTARYAETYTTALAGAGYTSDVYDVDAAGRTEPHPLGVLSHYRTVVWETGDDVVPRMPGQPSGTASRLALEIELAVRDYLNEGGKLLLAGAYAGFGQAQNGAFHFGPGRKACPARADPCLPLTDDFLQYYLGVHRYVNDGGTGESGPFPVHGVAGAFAGLRGTFHDGDSAKNQNHTAAFLAASGLRPRAGPYASHAPLRWAPPGGQRLAPYTGKWYAAAERTPGTHRRLARIFDLSARTAAALTFHISYEIEDDWDYVFVEAHTVGRDDWTTLPAAGRTSQSTGRSCAAGWDRLHPAVRRYQGIGCVPRGTTGEWHAASGDSRGWQAWTVDLTRYAGKRVEVVISYASDDSVEGLGVFVDDPVLVADGAPVARGSYETGAEGWRAAGWVRSRLRYEEGAAVVTARTVYFGFGLEGLSTPQMRVDLVRSALRHLRS